MMLSMACFAIEDTFIKILSARLPATQILFSIGFGGALITFLIAFVSRVNLADKILLNKHVITRTVADLFGALSFTSAMVLIPMSLLASILQATPLFVTLGAAVLLGEKVGWRRWSAILTGFVGVLIILQPGYGNFQIASLLGLAAVLCLALRDVVTRDKVAGAADVGANLNSPFGQSDRGEAGGAAEQAAQKGGRTPPPRDESERRGARGVRE